MSHVISGRLHTVTRRLTFVSVLISVLLLVVGFGTPAQPAAASALTPSVTIPSLKLPWDQSLTNIPLTGGPHGGFPAGDCVALGKAKLSGLDFGLAENTDVLAVAAGRVIFAGYIDSQIRDAVIIDHGGGFVTEYWHLNSIDPSIAGQTNLAVEQGRLLGKSGWSPCASCPNGKSIHLHLEFRQYTTSPNNNSPLSNIGKVIDGYTIHGYLNTSTDKWYNYEGTMTLGATITKLANKCGATGVKIWHSQSGPTIVANVNRTGGYLVSTNIETTGTTFAPGNLWVTGHDPDYHCTFEALQCHYLQVAVNFVTNGSTLPVLALDHGGSNEVATAINSAFGGSGPSVTTVDPRTGFSSLPLVDSIGTPLYSAIVVASDITCGGCDNNDDVGVTPDSDAINTRTTDIAQFFNHGGGILALAGAGNMDVYYNFLPLPATGVVTNAPYTFTSVGLTLGLVEGNDDNCCATHNSFNLPSSSGLQVAETDNAGNAETIISTAVAARNWVRPSRTSPQHVPQNKPHH